jgi:uncharacterized protein YggE
MMTKTTNTRSPRARAASAMPLLLGAALLPVFASAAHAQTAPAAQDSIVVTGRSSATNSPAAVC